jgi:hypothetical protein
MRIKVTYPFPEHSLVRQTPGLSGQWKGHEFFINQPIRDCDAWLVFGGIARSDWARCPPERTIFMMPEPPTIAEYNEDFIAQFAAIITSQPDIRHRRVFLQQPCIPWYVGIIFDSSGKVGYQKTYDDFRSMASIPKQKLISIVCSNKDSTEGHRRRLRLTAHLQRSFSGQIDVFGAGFNHVRDKWDAIAPYKYHIAIENSSFPHYWTEKLADSFLGGAFPFYWGCTNLSSYFPSESFQWINRDDPDEVVSVIQDAIRRDTYASSVPSITKSRECILERYNFFPAVVDVISQIDAGEMQTMKIRPSSDYTETLIRRIWNKGRSWIR